MKNKTIKKIIATVMTAAMSAGFIVMPVAAASTSGSTDVAGYRCTYTLTASSSSNSAYIQGAIPENPLVKKLKIDAKVHATYEHKEGNITSMVYTDGSGSSTAGGIRVTADKYNAGTLKSATGEIQFFIDNDKSVNLKPGPVSSR